MKVMTNTKTESETILNEDTLFLQNVEQGDIDDDIDKVWGYIGYLLDNDGDILQKVLCNSRKKNNSKKQLGGSTQKIGKVGGNSLFSRNTDAPVVKAAKKRKEQRNKSRSSADRAGGGLLGLRPRATASGTGGAPPPRSQSAGQNPFAAEPGAFDAPPLGHAPLRGPTASAPLRGVGGDREPRNLTEIERETWRRHVEDLRRGLEGSADAPAAAYAFGGVFSCEMYGSSEQRDQHDELYTEYVLRCRWGRTVDATRPWLVGRRFSEFAALDASLRGAYPSLTFPALPSSYVLFPLDPAVVEEREAGLGAYLGALLRDLPELLKTRHVDEFLQVSARIREVH